MVLVCFGCLKLGKFGDSGLSGNEWEKQNIWLSLVNFFANFWICFVIVATAPFYFSGVPGISNTSRIIFPLGKTRRTKNNLALF